MYKYLFFVILIFFLIAPLQVFAQERGFLGGPIVPCGIKSDPARSTPCTLCHMFVLAKNVIDFLFEIVLVIAPLFLLIGGLTILLSVGNPGKIDLGKRIITSTIIGIVIALVSWMAISTLLNQFVDDTVLPWPWDDPDCEGGGVAQFTYCHLQYDDSSDVMFGNYDTGMACRQECSLTCELNNCDAWCCLRDDRSGQEDVCQQVVGAEGEYCVCEIPRYNLLADGDLNSSIQIFTDIRVTNLNTIEDCQNDCTSSNSNFMQYCDQNIRSYPSDRYNLY